MTAAKIKVAFANAYWVVSHKLLAGEHPSDIGENATNARLNALLDAGVRTFFDLTEERENIPGYSEILRTIAPHRQTEIFIHRMPIPDRSVPSDATLKSTLDAIDLSIASQQPVYVHCFAGIGRTGTIVGCYLMRHGHAKAHDVVARISGLRRLMPCGGIGSPHTPGQIEAVMQWQQGS